MINTWGACPMGSSLMVIYAMAIDAPGNTIAPLPDTMLGQ